MMDAFRVWLIGLMAVSLLLTVLSTLLPEGSVRKIAGVTGGLVLLLAILRGISRLDLSGLRLSYDDCARQIDEQIETYRLQSARDMETLIEERCAAYISEQAQSFGLVCTPNVHTEQTQEGIPLPVSVTMDIPYHAELSALLTDRLGIAAENQRWLASEG